MRGWENYKRALGSSRPWHALKKSAYNDDQTLSEKRYAICSECPSLMQPTAQCKECGCFMKIKVKLKEATCPLGKW
jgi:hypothetical protein